MAEDDSAGRTMRISLRDPEDGEPAGGSATPWRLTTAGTRDFSEKKEDFRERRSEYEKLLASIYDAVLVTAPDGRILETNYRALDFFVCAEKELLAKNVVDLVSGADESLLSAIHRNLWDHRYTLIEATCLRSDGSSFPTEIAVNEICLHDEELLCFFIRNITERKLAQDALREAVARLEEHDRARAQFVSNVSHELKTPLTSMLYAINNMLTGVVGAVPDKVRTYLKMLEGDCRRMLATVNDILDLRKMESRTLTLERSRIPLAALVERSAESLRVQAMQKGLDLVIQARGARVFADCDAPKIERVVLNVVGNAIKFTPAQGRITVTVFNASDPGGRAAFRIQDNGIGIPPEEVGRVVDRYYTVGEQPSGSGLGLSISKEIVELHGGTLEIVSPPPDTPRGTCVSVSLPGCPPPKILIVEDTEAVALAIQGQLQSEGYVVACVGDGREALASIQEHVPDLIVLDLLMPRMSGTELIVKLRSDKGTLRVPIIVLTGASLGSEQADVLKNFGIPWLAKPWKEAELFDLVEEAFLAAVSTLHSRRRKSMV